MSGTASIQVKHNFETAHRLPFLEGKCKSLHGHSWEVLITFTAYQRQTGMNEEGISLEYGLLKQVVRTWIDTRLDHGTMVGVKDPLLPHLIDDMHTKLFVFGDLDYLEDMYADGDKRTGLSYKYVMSTERNYAALPWPTVEATARMLAEKLQAAIDHAFTDTLWIETVNVRETAVNSALWIPNGAEDGRFDRSEERLYATPVQAVAPMVSPLAKGEIARAAE